MTTTTTTTTAVGFHIFYFNYQHVFFNIFTSSIEIQSSDYYGDYFDSDYFLDYYTCQDDFCMEKEMWVEAEKKIPVPNTELIIHDSEDSHYVETAGVLAECAPGLGVKVTSLLLNVFLFISPFKPFRKHIDLHGLKAFRSFDPL